MDDLDCDQVKMDRWDRMIADAKRAGMSYGQLTNFLQSGILLQPRQMEMSVAARECDKRDGPTSIGVGGARGGGKSHWMLAQIAADDSKRWPGLKSLWLRKVGKANIEHLDDLRRSVLSGVPHKFNRANATLHFANDSRIVCGHYQSESDLEAYLGIEFDLIGVEEMTTLTGSKIRNIRTCLRSSKGWRPRLYATWNWGGVGHGFVKDMFIKPQRAGKEVDTRFIPATVKHNIHNNPEYIKILESLTGWQRRAWLEGDCDITAGQYFTNWREDKHVLERFDDRKGVSWFAALDYGYAHWTVVLLGCVTGDGKIVIVDEHASRRAVPAWHVQEVRKMLSRHSLTSFGQLDYFVAGGDVFGTESDGSTVAGTYADLGMPLTITECWNDRINGWAEIIRRLDDPEAPNFDPKLYVTRNCKGLIQRMPEMCHDENKPDDMMKMDCDEDTGDGGDDFADCLRYLTVSYKGGQTVKTAAPMRLGSFAVKSF
jgi:phage terminase large subunit